MRLILGLALITVGALFGSWIRGQWHRYQMLGFFPWEDDE